MSAEAGALAVIGDVHLDVDDPDLPAFLEFLDDLGGQVRCIVLMGDLFNLWLGRPELEQPHHAAVLASFRELRRRGVTLRYVEGNRDYRIGPAYGGDAFDDVAEEGLTEEIGGHRIFAVHGDLVNPRDLQYRRWRRFSRSKVAWNVFHGLPRGLRQRLALRMERRMRGTNTAFKRAFPEGDVRSYASRLFGWGYDALVLGHFHVERDLTQQEGRILVLPEWKGTRRYLRFEPEGEIGFVDGKG